MGFLAASAGALALLLLGTAMLVWQLWTGSPLVAIAVALTAAAISGVGYFLSDWFFKAILLLALADVALLLLSDVSIVS